MNIDQYRELKAQEEQGANQQSQEVTEPIVDNPQEQESKVDNVEQPKEEIPKEPSKITIEGIGEVDIGELKSGYLRQSDYTKKTQTLSREKQELQEADRLYQMIKQNPQLAQELSQYVQVPQQLDPYVGKVVELENKIYDMALEREIETLQGKYEDFEIKDVLRIASERNISNLEDAYILSRKDKASAPVDTESLKKQIREELLKELQDEKDSTQTIISSKQEDKVVKDNSPKLSDAEIKVATSMGLSPKEYAKWRDI